jgi:CRP-like cAMP-binding protein
MMHTLEPLLAQHPFFAGLDQRLLQILAGCATNVRFEAGQFVLREGEEADQFFLLRSGKVSLEIFAPQRGPIVIETLGEGDVLGWSWLTAPYRWNLDARALELTRAIALDGACLRGKCEADHDLGYALYKRFTPVVAQRLQATRLQLLDVHAT